MFISSMHRDIPREWIRVRPNASGVHPIRFIHMCPASAGLPLPDTPQAGSGPISMLPVLWVYSAFVNTRVGLNNS